MTARGMKKYRCHKVVSAAKITNIDNEISSLTLEGTHGWIMDRLWFAKHQPEVGGYFVRYEDGYRSYSPAEAFEAGYTLIEGEE